MTSSIRGRWLGQRTGLPAALLRGTPSAIRDDRFTRCPFPAATTHAPVALARSSNTAMEHRNRCTDLRHPEALATCCPCSSAANLLCNARPKPKSWTTAAFAQFQFFLTLRAFGHSACALQNVVKTPRDRPRLLANLSCNGSTKDAADTWRCRRSAGQRYGRGRCEATPVLFVDGERATQQLSDVFKRHITFAFC
jgi:hypothetical protein